jgi:hypothetical protein
MLGGKNSFQVEDALTLDGSARPDDVRWARDIDV